MIIAKSIDHRIAMGGASCIPIFFYVKYRDSLKNVLAPKIQDRFIIYKNSMASVNLMNITEAFFIEIYRIGSTEGSKYYNNSVDNKHVKILSSFKFGAN